MTQHRLYNQAKWCITMCLQYCPSQEWPLKFENSAKQGFYLTHPVTEWMESNIAFLRWQLFLLRFFVFVTVTSSIQLNLQIMGSSDTPVLQCIIPHGKRQLQSLVTHHRSSSGTCKDCGKFHNTFSISNDHKLIFLLRTLHFVHSCWLNTIAVQLEIFQLRIFLTC